MSNNDLAFSNCIIKLSRDRRTRNLEKVIFFFFFLLFLEVYRNIRLSLSTSVEYNRKLVREICNERNLIGKNLYEFSEKRFRNVQIYVSKR